MLIASIDTHIRYNSNVLRFYFQYSAGIAPFDMQLTISVIAYELLLLFALFFAGNKLHSDLMELHDMIYQSAWYTQSSRVQRLLLLMMIRAQRDFYIGAFGLMKCDLQNFVGVERFSCCASAYSHVDILFSNVFR